MAIETTPHQCPQAQTLFAPTDFHLFVAASFAGYHPVRLLVDNLEQPCAALVWSGRRGYIAGSLQAKDFSEAMLSVVSDRMPASIRIYAPDEGWETFLQERLPRDKSATRGQRQHYTCMPEPGEVARPLSDEITITRLDRPLLRQETKVENHHLMEAAIGHTNPSYEAFLADGWGICALHQRAGRRAYAGWCLAENSVPSRCEVGIKTFPAFQRQGIATAMTRHFVSTACDRDISQIGWHCWKDNVASVSTALKAGFHLAHEYSLLVIE